MQIALHCIALPRYIKPPMQQKSQHHKPPSGRAERSRMNARPRHMFEHVDLASINRKRALLTRRCEKVVVVNVRPPLAFAVAPAVRTWLTPLRKPKEAGRRRPQLFRIVELEGRASVQLKPRRRARTYTAGARSSEVVRSRPDGDLWCGFYITFKLPAEHARHDRAPHVAAVAVGGGGGGRDTREVDGGHRA